MSHPSDGNMIRKTLYIYNLLYEALAQSNRLTPVQYHAVS